MIVPSNPDAPSASHVHPVHASPSAFRAFGVLIVQSFQRLWRVRQMGWVSLALLTLVLTWVGIVSSGPTGWELANRRYGRTGLTFREYAEKDLPQYRYDLARYDAKSQYPIAAYEIPIPFDPNRNGIQSLILSVPYAILNSDPLMKSWGFMRFTLWVVSVTYFGFVLPLFTLSYATAAFGTDRESRSLVWLMTRPIPHSAIYLAKFLGALPWCTLFGFGGFAALCMAGGDLGRRAFALYWPAALAATVAFSSLFHLIGAIFKRPVVVGLVYVFFFEALVGALPGSLKLLSLTFYARSLMYNAAASGGYPVEMLDVPQAVSPTTAWSTLIVAVLFLTGLGMWLFSRLEYRDDT
jgi:ABC-type transport system involved in multi-copper enzyme maturation permease subunit